MLGTVLPAGDTHYVPGTGGLSEQAAIPCSSENVPNTGDLHQISTEQSWKFFPALPAPFTADCRDGEGTTSPDSSFTLELCETLSGR